MTRIGAIVMAVVCLVGCGGEEGSGDPDAGGDGDPHDAATLSQIPAPGVTYQLTWRCIDSGVACDYDPMFAQASVLALDEDWANFSDANTESAGDGDFRVWVDYIGEGCAVIGPMPAWASPLELTAEDMLCDNSAGPGALAVFTWDPPAPDEEIAEVDWSLEAVAIAN